MKVNKNFSIDWDIAEALSRREGNNSALVNRLLADYLKLGGEKDEKAILRKAKAEMDKASNERAEAKKSEEVINKLLRFGYSKKEIDFLRVADKLWKGTDKLGNAIDERVCAYKKAFNKDITQEALEAKITEVCFEQ